MWKRLQRFFASIAYAGLKPSGGVSLEPKPPRRMGALRDRIDLWLTGARAPEDPLYLTNRSWTQKIRMPLLVATPILAGLVALALIFTNIYTPKTAPPKQASALELMAKLMPNLEKTANIEAPDAEILELRVLHDGTTKVAGILKNKTSRVISVEFDIDLANAAGSRAGSATWRVDKAPANATVPFEFAVNISTASRALVRRIRTVL